MNDKLYLNENIINNVLKKLDELKQQSINLCTSDVHFLQSLIEQARQHA